MAYQKDNALAQLRIRAGFDQKQAARRIGPHMPHHGRKPISWKYLSAIECGERHARPHLIRALWLAYRSVLPELKMGEVRTAATSCWVNGTAYQRFFASVKNTA